MRCAPPLKRERKKKALWAPPLSDLEKGNISSFHRHYLSKGGQARTGTSPWAQGPWQWAHTMSQVWASLEDRLPSRSPLPQPMLGSGPEGVCALPVLQDKRWGGGPIFIQNPIQQSFS